MNLWNEKRILLKFVQWKRAERWKNEWHERRPNGVVAWDDARHRRRHFDREPEITVWLEVSRISTLHHRENILFSHFKFYFIL